MTEVHKFGLNHVQDRKEHFRQKAAHEANKACKVLDQAKLAAKEHNNLAKKYLALADKLDEINTQAIKETTRLSASGKRKLDGKRAKALDKRGLSSTCGVVQANTLLYATGDIVELRSMYWADTWVAEMFDGMRGNLTPSELSNFYDMIEKHHEDPISIQAEAGLLILSKQK